MIRISDACILTHQDNLHLVSVLPIHTSIASRSRKFLFNAACRPSASSQAKQRQRPRLQFVSLTSSHQSVPPCPRSLSRVQYNLPPHLGPMSRQNEGEWLVVRIQENQQRIV